jgi:hypothetical protein
MSLISRLFGKLFGRNDSTAKPVAVNDIMAKWERDRQIRIKAAEEELRDWIIASVNKNGAIEFSWESGGDEGFVTIKEYANNKRYDKAEDLEEYILDKLDIPCAGEFTMNGHGAIYIAGDVVKIRYSSTLKELVDFDEETEQEIYSNEEQDSGDIVMFSV